eukprot:scaffold77013_cov39-Tisochrysis_lutea.AAC.2
MEDCSPAQQEAKCRKGFCRARLDKDMKFPDERERKEGDKSNWAGVESHLKGVELARLTAH